MDELVHLDVAEGVATVTLDSQHNRNALSRQLVRELADRLTAAADDATARVVVIRSAHRVFCSGGDLSEAYDGGLVEVTRNMVALQRQILSLPKPVLVVLQGPVRAGGLAIVGAADIVIAANDVSFALTEVRLAVAPTVVSLTLLERFSDRAAAELMLTGRTFDATEAQRNGLVTHAVTDVDKAVERTLGELLLGAPQGFSETKRMLNDRVIARIDALGDEAAIRSAELFASDGAREAMAAFLQRSRGGRTESAKTT